MAPTDWYAHEHCHDKKTVHVRLLDCLASGRNSHGHSGSAAWGTSTRSWKAEGAERFAVKEPVGKVRPEVYNIFTGKALATMCLATPFWRDKYAGLAQHGQILVSERRAQEVRQAAWEAVSWSGEFIAVFCDCPP